MIVPPPLRPGDRVAAVAPSGPFDRDLALAGLAFLRERYEVVCTERIFERVGYLAGSDDARREELDAAIGSGARAIVAMRGGYGLSRHVDALDWGAFARAPSWLVGFSDATALHVEAARLGVASVHGAMVCSLGRASADARARWIDALERPVARREWSGLVPVVEGVAEGPLVGGNLTVLHASAAAGRLALPPGAIVLLEDVGERPYRVDRALTTLARGGHLDGVAGFVLGDFSDCAPGPEGVRVEDVLAERLATLNVPVARGLPVGHAERNDPVVLGLAATLDATRGRLEVGGER